MSKKITKNIVEELKDIGVVYENKNRVFFTDDKAILPFPNLIEVQTDSYANFLNHGLRKAFSEVFPIDDFSGEKVSIYFKDISVGEPRYSIDECSKKNLNFEAPLTAKFEMLNKETGEIKEDEVFLGGMPIMTEKGTFIVNGIERVIVNQIIKSDGITFEYDKLNPGMYIMKLRPKRGAWLEIMIDRKGIIFVKIDKKRKVPISVVLRAFGLEKDKDIIEALNISEEITGKYIMPTLERDKTTDSLSAKHLIYKLLRPGDLGTDERVLELFDVTFLNTKRFDIGEVARMKMNKRFNKNVEYKDEGRFIMQEDLVDGLKYFLNLTEAVEGFEGDDIDRLDTRRVRSVGELVFDKLKVGLARVERIVKDRMTIVDLDEATARTFINHRPIEAVLREFFTSSQLSQFMDQSNPLAELSHKRRITALGPGGLTRERASFEVRDVHPTQYGRICPVATPEGPNIGLVLHFATYAKVDKHGFITTPFQEIIHSVKNDGKDGINRITLHDIKDSNKNIIISEKTLITKALAEKLKKEYKEKEIEVRGFLGMNYEYFDAFEEKGLVIAEANTKIDEFGNIKKTRVGARVKSEATTVYIREVTHIDVSPKQIMSEGTALIPFVEHDDATRAEMGTNMMKQAVPLIRPQAPIVGTGLEKIIAEASGYVITAEDDGEVIGMDANHISVLYNSGEKKLYNLLIYKRSNHDHMLHQRPKVIRGDKFKKGDVLADGQSIENGELALGRNLRIAYMTWEGYNFEDAIVVSSKLIEDDYFTHVHIHEYSIDVRETKLGPESTTNDIPNVGTEKLKDLDIDGLVRVGARVTAGSILVGKVTPKGETELSPEERLLRAIFGDKSKDIKDSSLVLPAGSGGTVIRIEKLERRNGDNMPTGAFEQIKVYVAHTQKLEVGDKMAGRHGNKGIVAKIVPVEDMPFTEDGKPIDIVLNPLGVISRMNIGQILETHTGAAAEKLGISVATPILDGLTIDDIENLMKKAGIDGSGKVQLFDGKTGEPFKEKILVGIKYMLKLHHLVEEKIHARSVGSYSMVTQQPLGGKAQKGGQRFGEMEVWALEGYGAASILQEMLTIKSDDINGRTQAYNAIVRGKKIGRPDIPESFNVLLKELQALNMNIDLLDSNDLMKYEDELIDKFKQIEELEKEALKIDEKSDNKNDNKNLKATTKKKKVVSKKTNK